jgi:hypothetical protein
MLYSNHHKLEGNMKKVFNWIFVFVFILCLTLVNIQESVNAASSTAPAQSNVAEGSWTAGSATATEIGIDLSKYPAPIEWMQLMTYGVTITEPAEICHKFRGGRFGWTGIIYQLKAGKWVKLATTAGWVPNEEGNFMVCAQAPAAGTYALFGYYIEPISVKSKSHAPKCGYDMSEWNAYPQPDGEGGLGIQVNVENDIPAGTEGSFQVVNGSIVGGYIAPLTETSHATYFAGDDFTYFLFANPITYEGNWTITINFTVGSCSKNLQVVYED